MSNKILILTLLVAVCYADLCVVDSEWDLGLQDCPNNTDIYPDKVYLSLGKHYTSVVDVREVQYSVPGGDNFTCERNGTFDELCFESCVEGTRSGLKCNGDSKYCGKFKCKSDHHCWCRSHTLKNYTQIMVNGKLQNATEVGEAVLSRQLVTQRQLLSNQLYSDEPIYISMSDSVVFVSTSAQNFSGYISFVKATWNVIVPYTGGYFQFSIPQGQYLVSGTLIVSVLIDGSQKQQASFQISGRKICIVSDCLFCSETFNNWSCLHTAQKLFIVLCFLLLFCALLAACPVVFALIVFLFKCVLYPIKTCMRISRAMWRSKMKKDIVLNVKKLKAVREYVAPSTEMEDLETQIVAKQPKIEADVSEWERALSVPRNPRGVSRGMAVLMLMCLVCCANSQCTSGVFIPATFTDCQRNGLNQTCAVKFSLTTTLQTLGSASCFTVTNIANSSDIIFSGKVTYVNMVETFTTAYQYTTGDWVGVQGSRKRCDNAGPCSGNCKSVYPDDITAAGQLSDATLLAFQGRSICTRGCGCAGCNCFYCSSSCIYSRYSIQGTRNQGSVFQITSGVKKPTVLVELSDSAGVIKYSGYLDSQGIGYPVGPFTITVIGSLASDITTYIQNKLIILPVGTPVYYGPACDANAPVQGAVGEVQYTDSVSFIRGQSTSGAEHNYMSYDEGIVSLQTGSQSNSYTFKASSFTKYLNYLQLPALVAGNLWSATISGGPALQDLLLSVNSQVTTAGALLLTVETPEAISFSRTVDVVCPTGLYLNTTGCYNCELGAVMNLRLRSLCNGGFVALSTNTSGMALFTQSLVITRDEADYQVNLAVNRGNVDFCIKVSANGGEWSACGNFIVTAYTPFNTTGPDNNGTKTDNGGSDSGFSGFLKSIGNFFKDIFNGVAAWWKYIIFVIIVIIVLVAFSFALPFIIKGVSWAYRTIKTNLQRLRKKPETKKQ